MIKECKICGKEFNALRSAITCSKECSDERYRRMDILRAQKYRKTNQKKYICKYCSESFYSGWSCKFCSKKCHSSYKSDIRIGCKHTEEAKRKMRKNAQKYKEIRRQYTINMIKSGRIPQFDTSIERMVENQLLFSNILYTKQYPYRLGVADFWLPEYNIIIECDGDYWHSRPGMKEKDELKTKCLENDNYIVYRLREHDIMNNCSELIEKIVAEGV